MSDRNTNIPARIFVLAGIAAGALIAVLVSVGGQTSGSAGDGVLGQLEARNAQTAEVMQLLHR